MNITILLSFVGTSLVFGLIPGPSVCFTIAHALKHGAHRTFPSILGQLLANCCQIIVVLFGMSGILERSVLFFQGLKIGGAVYLVFLGYRQWSANKPELNIWAGECSKTLYRAFLDGFLICGTNPKAILFYAALLPQFVLPTLDKKPQLIILAITNVIIAALVLVFYTLLADRVRTWFNSKKYWKTQNRLSGILMIGAGIMLSTVSRK